MSMLSLKNVSYSYKNGSKEVLRGLDVNFEAGKLYVIMGKAGSGKTTLLKLMAGYDHATKGDIFFKGENIKDLNHNQYRSKNIGLMIQDYNLLNKATPIENLELAIDIGHLQISDKKKSALKLLESLEINEEKAKQKIVKLSTEDQLRVGIARALICNPELIIADELTEKLDIEAEKKIMTLLKRLAQQQNKCVIMVTQSRVVTSHGDEIWGLNAGRLTFVRERIIV